jgi:hypothetical protein
MSKNIDAVEIEGEWIYLGLPYGPDYDDKFDEIDSFSKRGLNKPGTLIEVRHHKGSDKAPPYKRQYLIGHINTMRGICDDCTAFDKEDKVLRYKVIWAEG